MKNKLVITIIAPLLTALLGFYAGYHIKRDQAPEANSPEFNPFLFAGGQKADDSASGGYRNPLDLKGELVRITNQSFRYETLPVRTQEEIYKFYTVSLIYYGVMEYVDIILLLNNIPSEFDLYPGTEIWIPKLEEIQQFIIENQTNG